MAPTDDEGWAELSMDIIGFNDLNNYIIYANDHPIDTLPVNRTGNREKVNLQFPEGILVNGKNKIRIAPRRLSPLTVNDGKFADEFAITNLIVKKSSGWILLDDPNIYRIGVNVSDGNVDFPLGLAAHERLPEHDQQPYPERVIKFTISP